jgi:hypothetical protein
MSMKLMQRNNLANAFLLVNDEATDRALQKARDEVGDAAWKQGHSKETEKVVREELKREGVRYETEITGKLAGVELATTEANGAEFQKLRVKLDNGQDRVVLTADLSSEFAQRLIAKLEAAEPGQTVTIGGFAESVERDGKSFVNHVATLKDEQKQEIKAVPGHFEKSREAIDKAQAGLRAAGLDKDKATMSKVAKSAREQYFAEVVQGIADRFPKREVSQVQPGNPDSYTVQQERTIGDRDAGADHAMWSGKVVGVDRERQIIDMESLIGGAPGVTRIHLQGSVPEGVEVGQRQKVAFDKETQGYTVASPDRSVQRAGQDRGIGA